jgi:hypothetical protein
MSSVPSRNLFDYLAVSNANDDGLANHNVVDEAHRHVQRRP